LIVVLGSVGCEALPEGLDGSAFDAESFDDGADERSDGMPTPGEVGELGIDPPGVSALISTNCAEPGRRMRQFEMPSHLGNGLVYDARVSVQTLGTDPEPGDAIDAGRQIGFRPVQIDMKPEYMSGQLGWSGHQGTVTLIADEDANHLVETVLDLDVYDFQDDFNDRGQAGWRPLTITPYYVDEPAGGDWSWVDEQRFAAIWVKDGLPLDWDAEWDLTLSELDSELQFYQLIGERPISIEGMIRGTEDGQLDFERRYAVVAARKEDITVFGDWTYSLGVASHELQDDLDDKELEGFVPYFVSTVHLDPSTPTAFEFNVLYAEAPSPGLLDVEYVQYYTEANLQARNDQLRSEGYHLVSVARHPDRSVRPSFTAIWHRYGWSETVEGDIATEAEDLEDLEEMMEWLMLMGRIPAAQLAVMKGDELVMSRAYTRAPVAYAPITTATPMMAASITKPFNAVLALQAFGVGGVNNGDLMSLIPAPATGSKPNATITVRQALQHTSGFTLNDTALLVKQFAGEDRLPTSMDWLEYMANLPGNGWNSGQQGIFLYNNFAWEMVVLAIKGAASIDPDDFEDYGALMALSIFDRPGVEMCRTAFKRQGLIDTAVPWTAAAFSEPEYGGCNSGGGACPTSTHHYLIESTHPYWGAGQINELANPGNFTNSALDDLLEPIAPDFVRSTSYGGGNAIHSYLGAGALVSTAEDLVRFMGSFRPFFTQGSSTVLLTQGSAAAMFPPSNAQQTGDNCNVTGRVNSGGAGSVASCYGLGMFVGNDQGSIPDVWNHGGDLDGAVTMVLYHPETDATVAMLFARHPFNAIPLGNFADAVLDTIAASAFLQPDPPDPAILEEDPGVPGYPGF
jgi:CubicO group peptidase (beta-lactamase class C family)